ncbi:putative sodium-dependent multivitamin transporter [Microplitis demolitor]|uniref:putative sodium-dependent multivitamin transporter n=1 Tax=Microplitis demolitor TaxID=69319 RepID=UPI0004CCF1AA|nr:putative sodium-dependent multivitamin transporter [Microplitis demolitor]XP_053593749.1 putative sodium-dependent multivitamin transporter [Microplitis demolitor]
MESTKTLGLVDYLVITLTIAISVGIGIYYRFTGGKQKTSEEYFSANRSMGPLSVGIALMVSFMSAITLLGMSAENYVYGTQFIVININYILSTPIICYGFLPVFYKLQATSTYEYLERRFGVPTRLLASFVVWLQMLLYSGVVLYAPALAFETTTDLSRMKSILSVGLACAFYSSIGGIKAVLITDIFQAVLMFASLIAVIAVAAYSAGGLDEVWNIASQGGRIDFNHFSIDPTERHTWWSLIIGGMCTFLSLYGVNQIQVQRFLTVKSLKSAQRAMWFCLPVLIILNLTTSLAGLSIYSKYFNCDPKTAGKIKQPDMLMPFYVMETMSSIPGLPGLIIAGVFSAGLSTISAALNSLAAVSLEDYIKPLYLKCTKKQLSPSTSLILGKFLAFSLGFLCIALAVLAQYLGSVLQTSLTIFGAVGGPLLGLFTLGMLFESSTQSGAILGTTVSLVFSLWISFGGPRPAPPALPVSIEGCSNGTLLLLNQTLEMNHQTLHDYLHPHVRSNSEFFYLYRLSYLWVSLIGLVLTITIGMITSKISRCFGFESQRAIDPDLFFPFIAKRVRKRLETDPNFTAQKYQFESKNNIDTATTSM